MSACFIICRPEPGFPLGRELLGVAGPFADKAEAQSACDQLRARHCADAFRLARFECYDSPALLADLIADRDEARQLAAATAKE